MTAEFPRFKPFEKFVPFRIWLGRDFEKWWAGFEIISILCKSGKHRSLIKIQRASDGDIFWCILFLLGNLVRPYIRRPDANAEELMYAWKTRDCPRCHGKDVGLTGGMEGTIVECSECFSYWIIKNITTERFNEFIEK